MKKAKRFYNLRSRFTLNKPSVLTQDATIDYTTTSGTMAEGNSGDADLLDLINQLQQANFAEDRRAKPRVRRMVVQRIERQTTWQRLRLLSNDWGQRAMVAGVSLMLFATLNLAGLFGLPQRTQQMLDQPVIAARSLVIPVLTVTLPLKTADFFHSVTRSGTPIVGISTVTPLHPLVPTPMPVPVPNQES